MDSTDKTQCINGELQSGDLVISVPETEYACLIGKVIAVNPWGTPEHDTDNPADDVHVDFTAEEYPKQRQNEIAAMFTGLYGKKMAFEDCPIDDAIMPSDSLIRITGIERDVLKLLLYSADNAAAYCKSIEQQSRLFERLDKNLCDYHEDLMGFGKQEIIEMAARAAAVSDVYSYITTKHDFQNGEVEYLLNFQNPLEVVTDAWEPRLADLSDLGFTIRSECDRQEALRGNYALMPGVSADGGNRGRPENPPTSPVPDKAGNGAEIRQGKKPSIMAQLEAAQQAVQSEKKQYKPPGASKDEPR